MMYKNITLFHGDNTPKSRLAYIEWIRETERSGVRVTQLTGVGLQPKELQLALESPSLFDAHYALAIEKLISQPPGRRRDALFQLLENSTIPIALWEDSTLTPAMQKKFSAAQKHAFPLSKNVFQWLGHFGQPISDLQRQLLSQAVEQETADSCFALLIRQVRLIIQVADSGSSPEAPPFVQTNLQSQARRLSLESWLQIHRTLLSLDLAHKQSGSATALKDELLWLAISAGKLAV